MKVRSLIYVHAKSLPFLEAICLAKKLEAWRVKSVHIIYEWKSKFRMTVKKLCHGPRSVRAVTVLYSAVSKHFDWSFRACDWMNALQLWRGYLIHPVVFERGRFSLLQHAWWEWIFVISPFLLLNIVIKLIRIWFRSMLDLTNSFQQTLSSAALECSMVNTNIAIWYSLWNCSWAFHISDLTPKDIVLVSSIAYACLLANIPSNQNTAYIYPWLIWYWYPIQSDSAYIYVALPSAFFFLVCFLFIQIFSQNAGDFCKKWESGRSSENA